MQRYDSAMWEEQEIEKEEYTFEDTDEEEDMEEDEDRDEEGESSPSQESEKQNACSYGFLGVCALNNSEPDGCLLNFDSRCARYRGHNEDDMGNDEAIEEAIDPSPVDIRPEVTNLVSSLSHMGTMPESTDQASPSGDEHQAQAESGDGGAVTESCAPPVHIKVAEGMLRVHEVLDQLASSPYAHDAIELALAVATSIDLYGSVLPNPVWLLLVGPPSGFKSATILALQKLPDVEFVDVITEGGLASGFVNPVTGNTPTSYLSKMHQKCLAIKELSTLFSMRSDKVKKILGELNAIHDGYFAKITGTVEPIRKNCLLSILAGITPAALHKHHNYMSMIGSRFLMYRVGELTDEERGKGFDIIWDEDKAERPTLGTLQDQIAELVNEIRRTTIVFQPETEEHRGHIERSARFLARARGQVIRSYDNMPNDHQIEEPFRLVRQLRVLARSLARIHGRNAISQHDLQLLDRVVMSSIPPQRYKVLCHLGETNETTRRKIGGEMDKSLNGAANVLDDLAVLGVLTAEPDTAGRLVYQARAEFAGIIQATRDERIDHLADLRDCRLVTQGVSANLHPAQKENT